MMQSKNQKSNRQTWLMEGLVVLREEGERGLTIEAMCTRMAKTKGAFYHHFSGRDDFVVRLLEHWEQVYTERLIEDLASLDDPRDRLRGLAVRTIREVDLPLERTIRFWSDREPAARAVLERVDRVREGYLREQFGAATGDPARARAAARAHMALLVGAQVLFPDLDRDAFRELTAFIDYLGLAQETS